MAKRIIDCFVKLGVMKQPCTLLPAERSHIHQAPDSTMGSNASFYATWSAAFEAKDEKAIAALYHDECEWVWHSSGKTMNKETWLGMMPHMFKMPPFQKPRCVYENGEICVSHSFAKFPSGDTEAVMMVQMLRDGKVYRVETGSTLVPKESPNYIE